MRSKERDFLLILFELGKLTISLSVAMTTLTGYVLKSGTFKIQLFLPVLGVFFLASGSSALNHFQERDQDALMGRTKNRPLPSGNISAGGVITYSIALFIIGAILLWVSDIYALLLGLLAIIWYNFIYTRLKRKTAFAVVPGAFVGAIPPLIGWVSAGGNPFDYEIIIIAFFFFIGQIPHFWLILLKYGKEYEAAGFPSITQIFNDQQIKRLTFTWIVALAVSSVLFLSTGLITSYWLAGFIILFALLLIISFGINIFSKNKKFQYTRAFFHLNLYFLLLMLLLCVSIFPIP